MIRAWNIVAVLVAGLVVGFGVGWWMNTSESPALHQVGDYDFFIFPYGPDPDKPEFMGYEGFGLSWPAESREERPRLVALITEDYLELVDFEALPPGFQEALVEEAQRGIPPRITVKYDDDTSDDPR